MKLTAKHYAETLHELCSGKEKNEIDSVVKEFIEFLAHRGKSAIIKGIQLELGRIVDREQGIVRAKVVLAEKDAKVEKALATELIELFGENIVTHTDYDPSIIGGVIITVGDTVVDASILNQCEKLQSILAT